MEDGYAGCAVGIYTAAKPKEVVFCNLSLTETAAETLSQMAKDQYNDCWYLYITIVGGGCSGYLYDVQILDNIRPTTHKLLYLKVLILLSMFMTPRC